MDIITVSLFGHREILDLRRLDSKLFPIVKSLMSRHEYITFLIGRNGEFDEYSASIIKRAQKVMGKELSELNLVLPYSVKSIEDYEKYYDNIIIPESVSGAHYKVAIVQRNRQMVEESDLVLVYVDKQSGGAFTAMKYAEKLNKRVINLCDVDEQYFL